MSKNKPQLYTFHFFLLCASHVLFAASFTMIIPELPSYLTSLGGENYKGLIISLFTLTAGISRPFSGKLTDTIGRVPVMIVGTVVCVVCSLFYPFVTSIFSFFVLRFFHGFSTGFKPTASSAYVADIIPANRRGEGMGVLAASMSTGSAIAPSLGGYLAHIYSVNTMFYTSSVIALVSIVILLGLEETLKERQPFRLGLLRLKKDEVFDPAAIQPAIFTVLIYYCFGVMLTIIPDFSEHLGMNNKGLAFSSLTLFTLLSRVTVARVGDRYGYIPVLKVSVTCMVVAIICIGLANSPTALILSTGLLGFTSGVAFPSVFAWTVNRSSSERYGRSIATVYIALEVGIGLGALVSAWLYANQAANLGFTFFCTAGVTFLSLLYLQFANVSEAKITAPES